MPTFEVIALEDARTNQWKGRCEEKYEVEARESGTKVIL